MGFWKRCISAVVHRATKHFYVLSLAVFIFGFAFFSIVFNFNFGSAAAVYFFPGDILRTEFVECLTRDADHEIYDCMYSRMSNWYKLFGTAAVLREYAWYGETYGETTLCHNVGHVVGEKLYEHNEKGLLAVIDCNHTCQAACFHGVEGADLGRRGLEAFIADTSSGWPCTEINTKRWQDFGFCLHGLGHMFMVGTDYDYHRALRLCADITGPDSRSRNSRNCASGVFMELFNGTIGGHTALQRHIKEEDIFWPCTDTSLADGAAAVCLAHIHSRLRRDDLYRDVGGLEMCRRYAPERWQAACARGVGYIAAVIHSGNIDGVVAECRETEHGEFSRLCLTGALVWYTDSELDDTNKNALCERLWGEEITLCAQENKEGTTSGALIREGE